MEYQKIVDNKGNIKNGKVIGAMNLCDELKFTQSIKPILNEYHKERALINLAYEASRTIEDRDLAYSQLKDLDVKYWEVLPRRGYSIWRLKNENI